MINGAQVNKQWLYNLDALYGNHSYGVVDFVGISVTLDCGLVTARILGCNKQLTRV